MEYVINLLEEKLGNLITLRTEDKIYCTDNYSELDFKHEYQLKEAIKILNGETVKGGKVSINKANGNVCVNCKSETLINKDGFCYYCQCLRNQ